MTTGAYFVCALAASMLAVAYLLQIDEKRNRVNRVRRALALPKSRLVGWVVVFLPSVVLIGLGQLSALLVWLGATTVASWLMVCRDRA